MSVNGIDESGPCGSRGSFSLFWRELIDAYISRCAEYIARRIGPENVTGIFLCGSFSLSEGGVSFDSSKPVVISDIDLLVVLRRFDEFGRFYPIRFQLGESCEELADEIAFAGHVDVAMTLAGDLRRMPPRPGVYDLKTHGRIIFGGAETLDLIPDYKADQIGGGEAVILLENRIASLLGRFGECTDSREGFPYSFIYEIARVYTDIATALLCASGLYTSGYAKRAELFQHAVRDGRLFVPVSADLADEVASWTRFKLEPTRSHPLSGRAGDLRGMWDQAARRIVECWCTCESHIRGVPQGENDVSSLLAQRQHSESVRGNLIAWREHLAGKPMWNRIRCLAAHGMRIFRQSPASCVREVGVHLLDHYVRGDAVRVERRMPGSCRRAWMSWEEAASEVSTVWREMVYGRRDR
jgi:hypothetical protein